MGAKKPSWREVVASVLAAMLGVQSDKNRQRDFGHGNLVPYLAVGVVAIVIFVLSLVGLVSVIAP